MDLVVSEIEIREKSLYKDWGCMDPMTVINVATEAQLMIETYLDEPYASMTVAELRGQKIIYNAHALLACAYLYRNKAAEATEDKVTEQLGESSETATSKNMDFMKLYSQWENLAWRILLPVITTDDPPVVDPKTFKVQLPSYLERNPRAYSGNLSGVAGNRSPKNVNQAINDAHPEGSVRYARK